MRLRDHLLATGETETAFAVRIGVAPSTIIRINKGERRASADLMEKIHGATGGVVQPNDFFDLGTDRSEVAA